MIKMSNSVNICDALCAWQSYSNDLFLMRKFSNLLSTTTARSLLRTLGSSLLYTVVCSEVHYNKCECIGIFSSGASSDDYAPQEEYLECWS